MALPSQSISVNKPIITCHVTATFRRLRSTSKGNRTQAKKKKKNLATRFCFSTGTAWLSKCFGERLEPLKQRETWQRPTMADWQPKVQRSCAGRSPTHSCRHCACALTHKYKDTLRVSRSIHSRTRDALLDHCLMRIADSREI